MLFVDRRVGSRDLLKPLRECGLDVELTELPFADVAFQGRGMKGAPVDIGIELKTLSDLIGSLRSGRLAGHQLPGLRDTYLRSWLIVEGLWRHDDHGRIVTYQGKQRGWGPLPGRMAASELEKQVLTLELCGGLHVRYTNSRRDTVRMIATLYHWWTDVAQDQHTSHLAIHDVPTLVPISATRQALMKWPGVGLKTSAAVARHFGSVRRAAAASVEEWASIVTTDDTGKTRRFGTKAAHTLHRFLEGDAQ